MRNHWFAIAIAGAGSGMRNVALQLLIWCSCTMQHKRASTVPVIMIGVHYLHYVQAPNLGLSNFVKLTSKAFALSCMIFKWFKLMLPRRVTHTLTSKERIPCGMEKREYEFAGNEVGYAVSQSPPLQAVSGPSSQIDLLFEQHWNANTGHTTTLVVLYR